MKLLNPNYSTIAIRSIRTCNPTKHLFYPTEFNEQEMESISELEALTSGIDHQTPKKDRWHQYGDEENLDYSFGLLRNKAGSRFSDGTFPVWYGCLGEKAKETSVAEVTWNSMRQTKVDLSLCKKEKSISFEFAFSRASISLNNAIDFSDSEGITNINHSDNYQHSQTLGAQKKQEGHDGLLFSSRRLLGSKNCAIFTKESIQSSVITAFWSLNISKDDTIIYCGDQLINFSKDGWMSSDLDLA